MCGLAGFIDKENKPDRYLERVNKTMDYLKRRGPDNSSVYKLKNGGFAVGTISDGVLFLTNDGSLSYNISLNNGLINNTVLSLFEDKKGKVWLGLDNGINSIDIKLLNILLIFFKVYIYKI